jgi:MFS family permease
MSFMSVVAPAIIALWFTSKRRGKAMGVWSIWVPLGSTIMFIVAPPLAGYWGWKDAELYVYEAVVFGEK